MKLRDLPCCQLSYGEPNAETNWEQLLRDHPVPSNCYRVQGVEGFDTAHKMAALLSPGRKFLMFDADTRLLPGSPLFDLELERLNMDADDSDGYSLCFASLVSVLATPSLDAGISYGNGGIKIWSRKRLLRMLTHEHARNDHRSRQVEFCFESWYRYSHQVLSVSVVNCNIEQAFRSGLREGYKLPVAENADHLLTAWLCWGADVQYGQWSMLGAAIGTLMRLRPEVVRQLPQPPAVINDRQIAADLLAEVQLRADYWQHYSQEQLLRINPGWQRLDAVHASAAKSVHRI